MNCDGFNNAKIFWYGMEGDNVSFCCCPHQASAPERMIASQAFVLVVGRYLFQLKMRLAVYHKFAFVGRTEEFSVALMLMRELISF